MARTCRLITANGKVKIRLSVTNALISGGDFKIYDFTTGKVNETFKIHTDANGEGFYEVKLACQSLIGQVLSWQVLTCSPVVTDSGNVLIEVFQSENSCQVTPLAQYSLTEVPNCSINQATPLQGGMHFQQ